MHDNQQFRRAFDEDEKPALPYRPDANRYPAVVKHEKHGKQLVNSKDEHDALNDKHSGGWDFPGHEAEEGHTVKQTGTELSQEADERISELEDRVTQLEAMLADLISKKKPKSE